MDGWMNPTAWLTAVTAGVAAWIAYQQFRTARHRLRLDLFERRMAVYEATISLIQLAIRDANLTLDSIFVFVRDTRQARFLFDGPLIEYLEKVRVNSIELRTLNSRLHEQGLPVGEERSRVAEQESQLLQWFLSQADGSTAEQFNPYLSFHDVR